MHIRCQSFGPVDGRLLIKTAEATGWVASAECALGMYDRVGELYVTGSNPAMAVRFAVKRY